MSYNSNQLKGFNTTDICINDISPIISTDLFKILKTDFLDILGGIRSACTYVGARRLKDLTKCATFVKVYNTHNRIYE